MREAESDNTEKLFNSDKDSEYLEDNPMDSLTLIEEYLNTNDASATIYGALDESTVAQIKKQKPWLVPLLDALKKKAKIDSKYIPWAIKNLEGNRNIKFEFWKIKKRDYDKNPDLMLGFIEDSVDIWMSLKVIKSMKQLAARFEQVSKAKKFDKAIKLGLFKNRRVKDIMFWTGFVKTEMGSGKAIHVLDDVLTRLEGLQTRKEVKSNEADLIYKDNRFTVYSPLTHKASTVLGAGTKWCIAERSSQYFDDYTNQGVAFAFIMDAAGDKDHYKIAAVYNIPAKQLQDYYNAPDDSMTENEVKSVLGSSNWTKLKSKIEAYMSKRKIAVERASGDIWAGDLVEYNEHNTYDMAAREVDDYFLNGYHLELLPRELLYDDKLRLDIVDALDRIYYDAQATVVDPVRSNPYHDSDAEVSVEGKYGIDDTDWDDVLDRYLPLGKKPSKHPDMDDEDYQDAIDKWETTKKARKEFEDHVVKAIKGMSGSKWVADVAAYDLTVIREIDPEDSIKKYGMP